MAVTHAVVAVGTSAVRLDTNPVQGDPDHHEDVVVQCPTGAATPLLLGGPGVTAASFGMSLAAGTSTPVLRLNEDDQLWAIVAAGTVNANVLRTQV